MNGSTMNVCEDQNQALHVYLSSLLCDTNDMGEFTLRNEATANTKTTAEAPNTVDILPETSPASSQVKYFAFIVAGLKLALPVEAVASVADFSQCWAATNPPLILGVVDHAGTDIPVLDVARIVMPNNTAHPGYEYIVLLKSGRCALACHSVEPILEAAQDDVVWKTAQTSRRWLAGTMIQHRCAVLDESEIERLIS